MNHWTQLEFLPFLPIDPARLPENFPPDVAAAAAVFAPSKPEWRIALLERALDGASSDFLAALAWDAKMAAPLRDKLAASTNAKVRKAAVEGPRPPPTPSPSEAIEMQMPDPGLPSEALDKLFAEGLSPRYLLSHPNATQDQLRRWAKDPSTHGNIVGHPDCPPDVLELVFKNSQASYAEQAVRHPNFPQSLWDKAPPHLLVQNPALPEQILRAFVEMAVKDLGGKDEGPASLLLEHITWNYSLSTAFIEYFDKLSAGRYRKNLQWLPNTPTVWRKIDSTKTGWSKLARDKTTSRAQLEQILNDVPDAPLVMAALLRRRDIDDAFRAKIIEAAHPDCFTVLLRQAMPAPLRERLLARIREEGDEETRYKFIEKETNLGAKDYEGLCRGSRRIVDHLLLRPEREARLAGLAELGRMRPDAAEAIALHPDRGGPEDIELGALPLPRGMMIGGRRYLLAPPSTAKITTKQTEADDEIGWLAQCDFESGRVSLVTHGSGAFEDDEALKEWLQGLSFSSPRDVDWYLIDSEGLAKKVDELSAEDLANELVPPDEAKTKKRKATADASEAEEPTSPLLRAVRAFAKDAPRARRILLDDGHDENQELGIWLLGEGKERVLVVRRWEL